MLKKVPHLLFVLLCAMLPFWLLTAVVAASSHIIHVTATGNSGANGDSWGNATTLQNALTNLANSGDEIWVASGVYTPGATVNDTFNVPPGVQLYGGFNATETARNQRNWQTNLTILSGDIGGDDTTDPNGVVTDTANIVGANSYNVLYLDGAGATTITETTVIDGFTITAGQANGWLFPNNVGGALFCNGGGPGNECSPTLTNLIFSGNFASAGGAIFNYGRDGASSPKMTDILFRGNEAQIAGGAIYNTGQGGQSSPVLVNVALYGNSAGDRGGAMYSFGDSVTPSVPSLTNVTIAGNWAVNGGGLFNEYYAHPALENAILWGNVAQNNGQQLYNLNNANPYLTYTIIPSGANNVYNDSAGVTYGGMFFDADPLFVAPEPAAAAPTTAGNYRLQSLSPARDVGDNSALSPAITTDLDGRERILNGVVDLGAYEYNPIIRVTTGGNPAADGSNWANATTLQNALTNLANSGDEIWVASGAYTPGATVNDTFNVPPGVQLYGGFAATETVRNQRDWQTNLAILSGDIGGDDTTDPNGVITDTANINGGNSYHVLYLDGAGTTTITETTVIDGFTITAGSATGSSPNDSGGGLYCRGSGAGKECSPTLANLLFSGNQALTNGGALYNLALSGGKSSPTMTNIQFRGNSAESGGAVFNFGSINGVSSPTMTDLSFIGNAANYGGAVHNSGSSGGVSSPSLVNVLFSGNWAEFGGALYNNGQINGASSPSLINVTFAHNWADLVGGAMYNIGRTGGASSPALINSVVWGNQASIWGGQLYNDDATPSLSHTLIQSGTNDIYNDGSSSVSYGAGILTDDPLFVAPVVAALAPTTAGNYRLQILSPAINAGSNAAVPSGVTTDLDGNQRIQGVVDMGAYEWPTVCSSGSIVFVDKNAGGANNGSSWANAFTHLQTPLNFLSGPCEIWVASGVYTPGLTVNNSFNVLSGVQLYGGFAGTETARSQRNWQTNLTILSGDMGGDDTTDPNGVVTDTANIVNANSYHVLYLVGTGTAVTETTVIDGFTITAGQANGTVPDNIGGGMFCNGQGAGSECSPTLANLVFAGNWAEFGAALYNSGSNGGGSNPRLTDVRFSGNQANSGGGAIYNNGQSGGASSPVLRQVAFTGNIAGLQGGAMYNNGQNGLSSPNLANVLFSGNRANFGGALYNNGQGGSGVSSPSLINVTFAHNRAGFGGGAIYSSGTNGVSSPLLVNSIVWGNAADNSQGHQLYNNDATPSLSYTLIQSGTNDIHNAGSSSVTYGVGMLTNDPLFAAPTPASAAPTTTGDYHLQTHSPAIDVGNSGAIPLGISTDLDGNTRIFNSVVEMGAYENGDKECGISSGFPYILSFVAPVEIFVTNAGDIDCLQVTHVSENHPNATPGIQTGQYWQITATNSSDNPASGFLVDLTLPTLFTPDTNDKVCRYVGPGNVWNCVGNGFDAVNNTVTRINVNAFSDWAVGDDVGPTAVTVLHTAVQANNPAALPIGMLALLLAGISGTAVFYQRRRRTLN